MKQSNDSRTVEIPFLRTPFNYDRDKVSNETGLACMDPSLAKQSFAEESDINTIVKRFGLTGQLPSDVRMPTYADFEEVFSYRDAMNAVVAARESFMMMPADVRSRFGNDPGAFVDWCSDPENLAEAVRLGLAEPRKIDPPTGDGTAPPDSVAPPPGAPGG